MSFLIQPSRFTVGASYDADAVTYFAAMSVQPDATRRELLNDLIVGLKADSLWSLLDLLYLVAAHDAQAGRLNARIPGSYALATANSPTFTTDRGYAGDGTSSYLDTGFADNTGSVNWTQNSAAWGVYLNQQSGTSAAVGVSGSTSSRIIPRTSTNNMTVRIHGATEPIPPTVADGLGMSSGSRTSATSIAWYKNGAQTATNTSSASSAAVAGNVQLFRSSAGVFGAGRAAAMFLGAGLSDAQQAAIYSRIVTYLTAIGAN